jgi:hypothetical protein
MNVKSGLSSQRPFLHPFALPRKYYRDMNKNKRLATLQQICRQFEVALLYSFGSRAEEEREWFEERRENLPPATSLIYRREDSNAIL